MRNLMNLAEIACYIAAVYKVVNGNPHAFFAFMGLGIVISIVKKVFPLG